jgi:hypothetical protein
MLSIRPLYNVEIISRKAILCIANITVDCVAFVSCVEAGYNTSTVALRVVEGDEKGTRCMGV